MNLLEEIIAMRIEFESQMAQADTAYLTQVAADQVAQWVAALHTKLTK